MNRKPTSRMQGSLHSYFLKKCNDSSNLNALPESSSSSSTTEHLSSDDNQRVENASECDSESNVGSDHESVQKEIISKTPKSNSQIKNTKGKG